MKPTQIAVVGATGLVGRQIVSALSLKGHPAEALHLFASERSEGEELEYEGDTLSVEKATPEALRGMSVVILAVPPDVVRPYAEAAQLHGAWVVDVTGTWRATAPVVVPGFNDAVLASTFSGRIVSIASPLTQALVLVLGPLLQGSTVQAVTATALLGASWKGQHGVKTLDKQTADLMNGRDPEASLVFPHRLGFNVVPQVGSFVGDLTQVEAAVAEELKLVLKDQAPALQLTALQVPIFHGMTVTVSLQLGTPINLRERLVTSKSLKVLDTPAESIYPMPMLVVEDEAVHVGRLRGSSMVVSVDNVGRLASAAVTVALALAGR